VNTAEARACFLAARLGLSPLTLEQYAKTLDHLERECPELPDGPEPVRRALTKANSVWVRASWWRVWRAFFRWCKWEYGTTNPMERVERPRPPEVEMRALEPEEMAAVLAATPRLRDRCIIALGVDCGVRGSEFGGLLVMDVASNTIRITGKGNRQVRVPISPETYQLLRLLANQDGRVLQSFLFPGRNGQRMSRHAVYRIVRQAMERAGIPGPKLGPHALRHTLGKGFIENGGDMVTLQAIMRHRDIRTTRLYVLLSMHKVVEQHHAHSPLRPALRGAQGLLWNQDVLQQVEEVLEKKT
jgi:integrase